MILQHVYVNYIIDYVYSELTALKYFGLPESIFLWQNSLKCRENGDHVDNIYDNRIIVLWIS
jgi:hypothetical protein